jgi:polyisoprenoid-binding protein YceI
MSPARGDPVHFAVDANASLFSVQAFASGIVAVIAHSPKFAMRDVSGEVVFDSGMPNESSVAVTIRLSSLEIMDEVTHVDRREIERIMFSEVLENKVYPNAEFRSTRVNVTNTGENMYRVSLSGDVTLHGTTRGLGFESQLVAGVETLRAQGSFSLLQSDFGLKIASVANGTLKLKDELKFGFFLIARRKD